MLHPEHDVFFAVRLDHNQKFPRMSGDEQPSNSVESRPRCTWPDFSSSNPASIITPSVTQELSTSDLSSPPPFMFSRPDSTIPRKVKLVQMTYFLHGSVLDLVVFSDL